MNWKKITVKKHRQHPLIKLLFARLAALRQPYAHLWKQLWHQAGLYPSRYRLLLQTIGN